MFIIHSIKNKINFVRKRMEKAAKCKKREVQSECNLIKKFKVSASFDDVIKLNSLQNLTQRYAEKQTLAIF